MEKNVPEVVAGGLFSLIVSGFFATWQLIAVMVILYGLFLFGNLITGILYAKQTNTYSPEKAESAIYKKAGAIIAIIILFSADLIFIGLAGSVGFSYRWPLLGCFFSGYQAVHELISMIQNLKKLGNHVPAALEGAAKKAEEALNSGKIPDFNDITQFKDGAEQ